MKISQQFPQFKKERALWILTGTQEAEFHLAGDGVVEKLEMFRLPRIKYSDTESRAVRVGKTGVSGGGSKSVKEQYQQEFATKFKGSIKDIISRTMPTRIIVISPIAGDIEEMLPVAARKLIDTKIKKNLCERHPEEILEHIGKATKK